MKIEELYFDGDLWQSHGENQVQASQATLVLVFGDRDAIENPERFEYLEKRYPHAHIVGASTAGSIQNGSLSKHPLVATVVALEKGSVEVVKVENLNNDNLQEKSSQLINKLPQEGLLHAFILMGGIGLNGSLLAKGVNGVEKNLCVTGGLAGDGEAFNRTVVMCDGQAQEQQALAIGFYGESLHVSVGCETGWEEFGAERVVTKSDGNVVYEIDNKPALTLYEAYLGDFIKDLPTSGLRFPLNIRERQSDKEVVRVIMAINEDKSLLFAGDVPEGSIVRLMKTNVNNLVDGAQMVSKLIRQRNDKTALALSVSCSGRRSVLKELVDEELEVMQDVLGEQVHVSGFYSYGELAPFSDNLYDCKLHNQTMTLTVIYED